MNMKRIGVFFVFLLGVGFVHAQDSSTDKSVATPSSGVEEGRPSKEQRNSMREELGNEKLAVNSACQDEAKSANCGDKVVGRGLLKCIHSHKKASSDFKISDGCKAAMKSLKSEHRKAKHHKKHKE